MLKPRCSSGLSAWLLSHFPKISESFIDLAPFSLRCMQSLRCHIQYTSRVFLWDSLAFLRLCQNRRRTKLRERRKCVKLLLLLDRNGIISQGIVNTLCVQSFPNIWFRVLLWVLTALPTAAINFNQMFTMPKQTAWNFVWNNDAKLNFVWNDRPQTNTN